jgi:hypothetical protein
MRSVALAVLLAGCISIPPFHAATDDAPSGLPDGGAGPITARWISNAYREGGNDGQAAGTYMMSKTGYAIPTSGIDPGDLVLFIANIDNGPQGIWNLPTGFTQIAQHFYGPDTQTYVVGWKIAASEPSIYTGMYAPFASTSAAATISLIAVTGYDPANPIEFAVQTDHDTATNPADTGSPGLTTTADNSLLIYAAGADWTPSDGTNTVTLPDGYQQLASFGDRDTHWDWTCQAIAYKVQPTAGPTGPLTGSMSALKYSDSTMFIPGAGWSVLVAIAPRP